MPHAEVLVQLQRAVLAVKGLDPSTFTDEQIELAQNAHKDLGTVVSLAMDQQEARLNPPPEETPIAYDDLVHALSFLPAADLALSAQVSRHFQRATPEAVRLRLDWMAGGYFETLYDTYCPEFLHRIEVDMERAPTLIEKITKSLKPKPFQKVKKQLLDVHHEVVFLHINLVWDALKALDDGVKYVIEDKHQAKRRLLFDLLQAANIPPEELASHVYEIEWECHFDAEQDLSIQDFFLGRIPARPQTYWYINASLLIDQRFESRSCARRNTLRAPNDESDAGERDRGAMRRRGARLVGSDGCHLDVPD